MNKTQTNQEKQLPNKSALESFKIFFEHTDDKRVVIDAQAKRVKRPSRNIASKR
jgi:hypothetical protein